MECGITKSARKKGAVGNFKQPTIISAKSLKKEEEEGGGGRGGRVGGQRRREKGKQKSVF